MKKNHKLMSVLLCLLMLTTGFVFAAGQQEAADEGGTVVVNIALPNNPSTRPLRKSPGKTIQPTVLK